jgi:hypothetical protein
MAGMATRLIEPIKKNGRYSTVEVSGCPSVERNAI